MRRVLVILALLLAPRAHADEAGRFDYYLLALSWSPSWCAVTGDARGSPQCDDGTGFGWIVHGLWPQYERGWPEYCDTSAEWPSRAQTRAMSDIMGDADAAFYQWRKHGTCSGLGAGDYFGLLRTAYEGVELPQDLRRTTPSRIAVRDVEAAFLSANPDLTRDAITITCGNGRIREARICLSRDLEPRQCAPDTIRDCTARDALLAPVR